MIVLSTKVYNIFSKTEKTQKSNLFFISRFQLKCFFFFLSIKLSKRRVEKKRIELTNIEERFDLVPMKHEYAERWNRYPKKNLILHETICSFFHYSLGSETRKGKCLMRSLDDEKSFKPTEITKTCACVLKNFTLWALHKRSTWCSRNQQGNREPCEMELNNRIFVDGSSVLVRDLTATWVCL